MNDFLPDIEKDISTTIAEKIKNYRITKMGTTYLKILDYFLQRKLKSPKLIFQGQKIPSQ